jgi:hypothetical protein
MNENPETCEAVERWQQGKINIFDEMARLERERDEARLQEKLLRVENNHNWQANDLAEQAFRERDEARDLAYKLYWVAWDLKRFARAYANGYKEADDKEGVAKAEEDFYEACRDIARILGMENPEP